MTQELLSPSPALRSGRARTLHRPRVLIEDGKVVLRAACGLSAPEGFETTHGFITCDTCGEDS